MKLDLTNIKSSMDNLLTDVEVPKTEPEEFEEKDRRLMEMVNILEKVRIEHGILEVSELSEKICKRYVGLNKQLMKRCAQETNTLLKTLQIHKPSCLPREFMDNILQLRAPKTVNYGEQCTDHFINQENLEKNSTESDESSPPPPKRNKLEQPEFKKEDSPPASCGTSTAANSSNALQMEKQPQSHTDLQLEQQLKLISQYEAQLRKQSKERPTILPTNPLGNGDSVLPILKSSPPPEEPVNDTDPDMPGPSNRAKSQFNFVIPSFVPNFSAYRSKRKSTSSESSPSPPLSIKSRSPVSIDSSDSSHLISPIASETLSVGSTNPTSSSGGCSSSTSSSKGSPNQSHHSISESNNSFTSDTSITSSGKKMRLKAGEKRREKSLKLIPPERAQAYIDAKTFTENGVELVQLGLNGTVLPKTVLYSINWTLTGAAITRKILGFLFTRDELASSSLSGKPSPAFMYMNKPPKSPLSREVIEDIIFFLSNSLTITEKEIRSAITTKCADENKMRRHRLLKAEQQEADKSMDE